MRYVDSGVDLDGVLSTNGAQYALDRWTSACRSLGVLIVFKFSILTKFCSSVGLKFHNENGQYAKHKHVHVDCCGRWVFAMALSFGIL